MSPQPSDNDRFNTEASTWDSNPAHHTHNTLALQTLLSRFPALSTTTPTLNVVEIGCGTGILSLLLAPYVRSLVALDAAPGMITTLTSKLTSHPTIHNIHPVCGMLNSADDPLINIDPLTSLPEPGRKYDLIVSHLTLHHVPDLEALFVVMRECLREGGSVALTDFEDFGPQAEKFHGRKKRVGVVRHGIRRGEVKGLLEGVGFGEVGVEKVFEIKKAVERDEKSNEGEKKGEMVFPFLLCTGERV